MPEEDAELGDDFAYILRMADSDVDGLRPIAIGLTSIRGVGMRTSQQICRLAGINGKTLGGHLSEEEQDSLRSAIDDYATTVPWWLVNRQRDLGTNEDAHIVAMEVKMTRDDDISRMAGIKAYRGMRHRSGHKVRGQRLRSNGSHGVNTRCREEEDREEEMRCEIWVILSSLDRRPALRPILGSRFESMRSTP
tara:strand:+ start:2513 stop:3091 length:579 start_codon:yes stop_codon:yes gene_type:complete